MSDGWLLLSLVPFGSDTNHPIMLPGERRARNTLPSNSHGHLVFVGGCLRTRESRLPVVFHRSRGVDKGFRLKPPKMNVHLSARPSGDVRTSTTCSHAAHDTRRGKDASVVSLPDKREWEEPLLSSIL
ncbi:hypothetical protein EYF80_014757 [Liparis tanakae]|uniref:Uncharacterized protein n=1 Tax=Liparis tanakae TaxID=230148 RepID=A0A4Z2IBC9_9TELE|nr:hypothetical protein EYF80_014757 [Liparis tanakae]